jgi:hypothetical protein
LGWRWVVELRAPDVAHREANDRQNASGLPLAFFKLSDALRLVSRKESMLDGSSGKTPLH